MQPVSSENPSFVDLPVMAWAAWDCGGATLFSGGALSCPPPLPVSLRRRVTHIGRRALEAAWVVSAGLADPGPRIVVSSRHGEYARTVGLLRALAEGDEVSPAEFSLAVHHGLAGLLSIATGNRAGHCAVAAGADTLGAALTEAAACLMTGDERVLLIHFDEDPPPEYAAVGGTADGPCAFALLLGMPGQPLRLESGVADAGAGARAGGGVSIADAVLGLFRGESCSADLGGERRRWRLCRVA